LPGWGPTVPCGQLLRIVAAGRPWNRRPNLAISEGLPQVCEHCSGTLHRTRQGADPELSIARRLIGSELAKGPPFNNLRVRRPPVDDEKGAPLAQPRIVFVWSGGVFRGAFHIGMIGALLRRNIRPNLIAAASGGTLMGGALASVFSESEDKAFKRLGILVQTFKRVDENVALTKTLKEAARDLAFAPARSVSRRP
jgi:hypothetical protein